MLETLINGILIGGVYASIGLGLTLIFGVMGVINMAHGEFVMIGMFVSYFLFSSLGIDPFISVLITIPICFILGFILHKYFVSKALKVNAENTLLLTAGVSIFIINAMALPGLMGPKFLRLTGSNLYWENKMWHIGGLSLNAALTAGFILTILLIILLHYFLTKTDTGTAIRSAAQDSYAATIVGVNVPLIAGLTFGLGAAFAGVAGNILSTTYPIYSAIGSLFIIKAFVIVVLGGMGSILGAAIGGIILGIAESFGATYIPNGTGFRDMFGLVIFLLVLLFRPQGLFGRGSK